MKVCIRCKVSKDEGEFSKDSAKKDGKSSVCRGCVSKGRSKVRRPQRTLDELANDVQLGSKVCSSCGKRQSFNSYSKLKSGVGDGHKHICKACDIIYRRLTNIRSYGITMEVYQQMYNNQGGACAICGSETDLFVDHNHETGEVRGLLCNSCNTGVGLLKDSPSNLSNAIKYLLERGCYGS